MSLNKIFIESRYKNNILFNDMEKLLSIYRNNRDLFDSQNFIRNDNVFQLLNSKDHFNSIVSPERMTFDMDSPHSIENFKNKLVKYSESVNKILSIEGFERIGIRAFWGIEVESMQNATDVIQTKFFNTENKILSGKKSMASVGFSIEEDEIKINIGISPNQTNIVEINNGVTTKNIMRKEIMIDVDVYIDRYVDNQRFYSNIKKMIELNKNKANEINDYIKG